MNAIPLMDLHPTPLKGYLMRGNIQLEVFVHSMMLGLEELATLDVPEVIS